MTHFNDVFGKFSTEFPFAIGFDRTLQLLERADTHSNVNYPPYNIVKTGEYTYNIEVALAGFNKKDIEVKYADNTLEIKSIHEKEEAKEGTLHQGISKRHFTRSFTIAEDVEVKGAELKDGLLQVELEKIIPDSKKPRTISIK